MDKAIIIIILVIAGLLIYPYLFGSNDTTTEPKKTCFEMGGQVCPSDETCSGFLITASDSDLCCDGDCEKISTKCGDGICDAKEKLNSDLCPGDCESSEQPNLIQVLGETSLLPEGRGYWREDSIVIDGRIFLAFNDNRKTFKLVELNKDLSLKGQIYDIFSDTSGGHEPTDIRLASDGANLWYAFESTYGKKRSSNDVHILNLAKYDISGDAPNLISAKPDVARGYSLWQAVQENPEVVDDPTPLFYGGKYFVLTRAWKGPVQHIREFDQDFNLVEDFTLDLSSVIGDALLSQNALVEIGGEVYLIGGLKTGSPHDPSSNSDIYAIPLSDDLHSVDGDMVPLLVNPDEYDMKVTTAKYRDGKLYINYVRATGDGHQYQYLGVFDAGDDFKSIARIQVQGENSVWANHASFDIVGNRVYFFYPGDNSAIYAKVFGWQ